MMISKKVVVIGAGAAGLMAGATAALYGASVTIIEKNKRVGRKIMITGKGRCNLANNCDDVSIRDTATKAPLENYYHGFINGIFASCEKLVSEYHSNYEAGNGYPDITFKAERNTKDVIIEIKATSKAEEMDELAAIALSQIEEKNYAEPFTKIAKITDIYAYGIAFCKKDCSLVVKNLKTKP